MAKLIASTQATLDGVVDPVGDWVQPDGDHGDYSFERQARSSGLVLGRKTFEGLAGYWPSQSGKWADMVNAMPKYVEQRDPWVPSSELRRIVEEAPADSNLLDDLADVRGAELDFSSFDAVDVIRA